MCSILHRLLWFHLSICCQLLCLKSMLQQCIMFNLKHRIPLWLPEWVLLFILYSNVGPRAKIGKIVITSLLTVVTLLILTCELLPFCQCYCLSTLHESVRWSFHLGMKNSWIVSSPEHLCSWWAFRIALCPLCVVRRASSIFALNNISS
jgi:hypothetical protein